MGGRPVSDTGWKRSQQFSAGKQLRPALTLLLLLLRPRSLSAPPSDSLMD